MNPIALGWGKIGESARARGKGRLVDSGGHGERCRG